MESSDSIRIPPQVFGGGVNKGDGGVEGEEPQALDDDTAAVAAPAGSEEDGAVEQLDEQTQREEEQESDISDQDHGGGSGSGSGGGGSAPASTSTSNSSTQPSRARASSCLSYRDQAEDGEQEQKEGGQEEEEGGGGAVYVSTSKKRKATGGGGPAALRALQREDTREAAGLVAASIGAIVEGSRSAPFRRECLEALGLQTVVKRVKPAVQNRLEALL